MTQLVLTRSTANTLLDAVPGEITLDGHHLCWSMELPWRDNQHDVSCIPPGVYALAPHFREIGGLPSLALEHVPGRAGILIHVANWPEQINGCIAVGTDHYSINNHFKLVRCAKAMGAVLAAKPTSIEVKWDSVKLPKTI